MTKRFYDLTKQTATADEIRQHLETQRKQRIERQLHELDDLENYKGKWVNHAFDKYGTMIVGYGMFFTAEAADDHSRKQIAKILAVKGEAAAIKGKCGNMIFVGDFSHNIPMPVGE